MSIIELIAVIGAIGGLVSTFAVARVVVVRRQIADEAQHMLARAQGDLITEVMTRQRAQRHGYFPSSSLGAYDPVSGERREPAMLDPGAQEPPPDQRRELREWRAAWIEPNEEFILETDKILNDIEWERLTSAAQDAGGANDRWEQSA